ncbi:putative ABC transporter permease, partial [Klebsiella pneumoniae]|nr:putative ABC transporter permease [Klebsiella pneumoniae]
EAARQEPTIAQNGETPLSAADLLWLFVVGAFLGDLVETVFCRLTAGVWMSRSSLVWGPFSVVWGLALALTTVLLRQNQDKSDRYLFVFGTVM